MFFLPMSGQCSSVTKGSGADTAEQSLLHWLAAAVLGSMSFHVISSAECRTANIARELFTDRFAGAAASMPGTARILVTAILVLYH